MLVQVPPAIPPQLASLPAFPSVATKLLALLGEENSTFSSIAACIATDPVLSGQLIKRANAADYSRYCEVREVRQATVALGIDRTREISMATATSAYARSAMKSEILRPCWRHTLACALAASEIARLCGLRPAEPYTAGLLHDIGRLGLLTAYQAEYEEIMAGADGRSDDLMAIERERFGVDHTEAGLWLARQWNLPESIAEVIVRHHETPSGKLDQLGILQIACGLADLLGFSVNRPTEPPNFDQISAGLPESVRNRLGEQLGALQIAIAAEIRFFEGTETPGTPDGGVHDRERDEVQPVELLLNFPSLHADRPRSISLVAVLTAIAFLLWAAALFLGR